MTETEEDQIREFYAKFRAVRSWMQKLLDVTFSEDPLKLVTGLADGIVLCYLSRAIDEESIPRIQEDKHVLFKLRENLSFFLMSCHDFGVPDTKIFTLGDLTCRRIIPVFNTLEALAEATEQELVKEPPPSLQQIEMKITKESLDEIKKELAAARKIVRKGKIKPSALVIRTQIQLMTGQGLFPKFERGMTICQAMWRGYEQRKRYQAMVRDQAFREKVANEILKTEQDYVSQLNTCVEVFLNPLREMVEKKDKKAPLKKEQIDTIFINIEEVANFHKTFCEKLQKRVESGPWTAASCIGDLFKGLNDCVSIYERFAQQYPASIHELDEVKETKAMEAFLQGCKSKSRLGLEALLITPIQRIPRYILLLKEYDKHTWKTHRDKADLQEAQECVKGVGDQINRTKSLGESATRLMELNEVMKGIPPSVLAEKKIIIMERMFTEVKKKKPILVLLFSDSLITFQSDAKGKKGKFQDQIALWCIKVEADPDNETAFTLIRNGFPYMKLQSKTTTDAMEWNRIWRETKGKYDELRKTARMEDEKATAEAKKEAMAAEDTAAAADALIKRGRDHSRSRSRSRSRSKSRTVAFGHEVTFIYKDMTEEEKKAEIEKLFVQRISIEQQILTATNSPLKQEEKDTLLTGLRAQVDDILLRLEALGAIRPRTSSLSLNKPISVTPEPGAKQEEEVERHRGLSVSQRLSRHFLSSRRSEGKEEGEDKKGNSLREDKSKKPLFHRKRASAIPLGQQKADSPAAGASPGLERTCSPLTTVTEVE